MNFDHLHSQAQPLSREPEALRRCLQEFSSRVSYNFCPFQCVFAQVGSGNPWASACSERSRSQWPGKMVLQVGKVQVLVFFLFQAPNLPSWSMLILVASVDDGLGCFSINCYHLAQKNYLKVYFFCDFDMILLWFCYGFDVVENMVFLWFETISWRRYEFRYGFVMVWTCLQPAYFDRTFQDMYLYFWHILKLLLSLLKKKEIQIEKWKNEKRKLLYIFVYYWKMHISIKERLSINWKIRKGIKIILLILLYLWGQEKL